VRAIGHAPTIPGVHAPRRATSAGTPADGPSDSHLVLPIFFPFSYPLLGFPLGPPGTMVFMQGSAFHINRIEQSRRRANGPTLTLIHGSGGSDSTTPRSIAPRVADRAHRGFEGFTPDGRASVTPRPAVQVSELESPSSSSTSRGISTTDNEGAAHSGSGPIMSSWQFAELASRYLDATAGTPGERYVDSDVHRHSGDADIVSIR